jgi:hypothetical protein
MGWTNRNKGTYPLTRPLPSPAPPHLALPATRPDLLPAAAPPCCRHRHTTLSPSSLHNPACCCRTSLPPTAPRRAAHPGLLPLDGISRPSPPALACSPGWRLRPCPPPDWHHPGVSDRVLLWTGSSPAPEGPRWPYPPPDWLTAPVPEGPRGCLQ